MRLIDLDNMQPDGRAIDVEEIAQGDIKRAMCGIQLDAVAEEIARVEKLPQGDPARIERLYQLSRRQQALQQLNRAITT